MASLALGCVARVERLAGFSDDGHVAFDPPDEVEDARGAIASEVGQRVVDAL
jgi:hypothetical protein